MINGRRADNRGFALLFIVMIVAVVAVAAAALLDIVEVDLLIAGEARRTAVARAVAEGAIKEIQADNNKAPLLPTPATTNLTVRYAAPDGAGTFIKDPDNVGTGPVVLDEFNSAYVRDNAAATADQRQGYTAEMRLLRLGPAINNGLNTVQAVIYEIRAQSSIGDGKATADAYAETFSYAAAQNGTVGQRHAR